MDTTNKKKRKRRNGGGIGKKRKGSRNKTAKEVAKDKAAASASTSAAASASTSASTSNRTVRESLLTRSTRTEERMPPVAGSNANTPSPPVYTEDATVVQETPTVGKSPTVFNEDAEDEIPTVDEHFDRSKQSLFEISRDRRIAVAYCFFTKYGAVEDDEGSPWNGKGGIISKIRSDLGLRQTALIKNILEDVIDCKNKGIRYTGNSKCAKRSGRPTVIKTDSQEAQIIADAAESGSSQRVTWNLVNQHREDKGLPPVTLSAVQSWMRPIVEKIGLRKQGSMDVNRRAVIKTGSQEKDGTIM